ncbi:hypothetical protein QE152_g12401 [Popillia japonica]|uniref:Uncharacterized protein n=1 Tax=Popillia japonica TaxID=7064 RepID=A0AAW1LR74_POPJA
MEGKCNYFSAGSYFCNFIKGCMDPVITAEEIGEATQKDDILKEIYKFVMYGWPKESSDPKLAPYFKYKNDITTDGNCLIIGNKKLEFLKALCCVSLYSGTFCIPLSRHLDWQRLCVQD